MSRPQQGRSRPSRRTILKRVDSDIDMGGIGNRRGRLHHHERCVEFQFGTGPRESHRLDPDNVYDITVKATDDEGLYDELEVTVIVTDVNEVPVFPGATTTREVSENLASGQNVGSPVRATDPERDYLTYSLSGTDASHFDISTSTGQILTKSDLDYEGARNTYSVIVSVTDSKNEQGNDDSTIDATIEVTINVIDDDEAPEITGATSTRWEENATGTVATYTATDPENATTTWSVHGTDSAHFGIASRGNRNVSGDLYINTVPDYEGKNFYQSHSAGIGRSEHRRLGRDYHHQRTWTSLVYVTLSPSSPEVGTQVNASLTDPDLSRTQLTGWSWYRSSNKSNWGSPISGATGSAYTPVDADEGNYLRATASYEDGHGAGKSASGVSDEPGTYYKQPAVLLAKHNSERRREHTGRSGVPIGKPVTATDDETDDTLTYYELGGIDAAHVRFLHIDRAADIRVEPLDFEGQKNSYSVTVSVSDGKDVDNSPNTATDAVIDAIIKVNDVNEPPAVTGDEIVGFNENATATVATYTAIDPEKIPTISWDSVWERPKAPSKSWMAS